MKLNNESKAKLRSYIANKIKEAEDKKELPDGQRIQINK